MPKYEVELRGMLKNKEKKDLERFLVKNGKLVKKYRRTLWCFEKSWGEGLDLRIKNTNGEYIFSLKTGNPGKADRREISIPISKNKTKEAFDFLKLLGYKKGMKAKRNAQIYKYDGIEWAIIEIPKHGYYFEAEKMVSEKDNAPKAEKEIRETCQQLGLKIFTAKETMDYIAHLDRVANAKFEL